MASELDSYVRYIEDLHGQVRTLIAELPVEALNWHPIEGKDEHATNSLGVLVTHTAGSEHFWIAEVVGGKPATRDRDAEFTAQATDAGSLVRLLEQVEIETREVLSSLTPADLEGTRKALGRTVSVRWCILHVLDHGALHLGHMQLTYQLWADAQS